MDLKAIRTQFVKLSGRFDLVVDTVAYADAGADFFIKAGSRFLDRRADTGQEQAIGFYDIAIGDFFLELADCRVIEQVWADDGVVREQLTEVPESEILETFPGPLAVANSGFPAKYAPGFYRVKVGSATTDFLTGVQTDATKFNGFIFPPTDRVLKMEVKGKFYSNSLVEDTDTNYWSVSHEMLLIWATLYHLEISYRNSEGARDWLASIETSLFDLELDLVDQEGININQLKG